VDCSGRTLWIDAHRSDGKRFFVRAYEKLTALLELQNLARAWNVSGEAFYAVFPDSGGPRDDPHPNLIEKREGRSLNAPRRLSRWVS
jgi:hypothetical protein